MKSQVSGVDITKMCCVVPREVKTIESLSSIWPENEIRQIIKSSGIEEVRVANENTTSADLCVRAAEVIFEKTKINRDSVDGIIFVSQTPDYILPATSCTLQARLGIPQETIAIDINQGCCGFIYGMLLSSLLVSSGSCRRVLFMVGDTTTRLIAPRDKSLRTIFGDAGSATLIEKGEGSISFRFRTDGKRYDRLIVPAGGMRTPHSERTCVIQEKENGNYRSQEHLFMDGIEIMKFALSDIPPLVEQLLMDVGWLKTDVDCYIFHQANRFILDYMMKKMKLPAKAVPIAVRKYGNTGPASIPLALTQSITDKTLDSVKLKRTVAVGFGVGLCWGAFAGDLSKTQFLGVHDL